MPSAALRRLSALRDEYSPGGLPQRLAALQALAGTALPSAAAVRRLHELLCWLRAYPADADELALVRRLLAVFHRRPDLRRHAAALADSGMAGTPIRYRFFAGQARWLAEHWPQHLSLQRDEATATRIAAFLPALLTPTETQALVELKPDAWAALDRLAPKSSTDAAFLQARIAAMPGTTFTREAVSDFIDAEYLLAPGADTPNRTRAEFTRAPLVFRQAPPSRQRPDLRAELARPPQRVRRLSPQDGRALIDLARAAMVTRARSLEAFSFAEPRDAWWVDDGDGLVYTLFGVEPARRHALATWVGGLTLRNGVPIGYVQSDHVGRSAHLSFNTFDTFRGGEAAFTFARWLAAIRAAYGATSFSIDPYQLGYDNPEALDSGAWWFYARLGFAPREPALLQLMAQERQRLAARPGRRSPPATLRRLASKHLFFDTDPARPCPLVPLGELGLAAGARLSALAGASREQALAKMVDNVVARIAGAEDGRRATNPGAAQPASKPGTAAHRWSPAEREALSRLAPLLAVLDTDAWTAADWAALAPVVRAKAARSERGFAAAWLAHPRLDAGLQRWALAQPTLRGPRR